MSKKTRTEKNVCKTYWMVKEWETELSFTSHSRYNRSFGDESFQAINFTDTDNKTQNKQENIHKKNTKS